MLEHERLAYALCTHDGAPVRGCPPAGSAHTITSTHGSPRAGRAWRARRSDFAVTLPLLTYTLPSCRAPHGSPERREVVDEGVDTGPHLAQAEVQIHPGETEAELHERIKVVERELLVDVVKQFAEAKAQQPA